MATFKSLTKKEKKHLKEVAGVSTLTAFTETAAEHKRMREAAQRGERPKIEPCHDCRAIAVKLGLPV